MSPAKPFEKSPFFAFAFSFGSHHENFEATEGLAR